MTAAPGWTPESSEGRGLTAWPAGLGGGPPERVGSLCQLERPSRPGMQATLLLAQTYFWVWKFALSQVSRAVVQSEQNSVSRGLDTHQGKPHCAGHQEDGVTSASMAMTHDRPQRAAAPADQLVSAAALLLCPRVPGPGHGLGLCTRCPLGARSRWTVLCTSVRISLNTVYMFFKLLDFLYVTCSCF